MAEREDFQSFYPIKFFSDPDILNDPNEHKRVYPKLLPPESSPSCSFRPIQSINNLFKKAYYWMDTFAHGGLPSTAIPGGSDIDGHQIYVGRAFHEGDWIPAKVIPGKNVAYISYGGTEHAKDRFQVLCEQRFDWVPCENGQVPEDAVEGGRTVDGEALYIGRVKHKGSNTVGKVHPSYSCCFIPFDGREIPFQNYEVLVLRK